MASKVVKISKELYDKVKAIADSHGITMAKALENLVEGKPLPEEVEAFVPSCAAELGVRMPTNYGWIKVLAEVLPAGLRGKLEPYAKVLECAEAKAELKKLAEVYLEEVEAVTEAEVTHMPKSWSVLRQREKIIASEERTKELLGLLSQAVVDYDDVAAEQLSRTCLEEGVDPYLAVMKGLAEGMRRVGAMYEENVYFVPEVLLCADALYRGLDILRPAIPKGRSKVVGILVIGVLEGDVHDIGKNLVKMMFDIAGWTVYDLGRNVEIPKFAVEQIKTDAEMVGLSAMMTTSMLGIPEVIKIIKERNPDVQIIIGGSPITEEIKEAYGADGYAPSAANAVDEAVRILEHLKQRLN